MHLHKPNPNLIMFEIDLRTFLLQCELILLENAVAFSLIQFYISIKVSKVLYSWALASYLANISVCKRTEKRQKKPTILRGTESVHFNVCCVYLCNLIEWSWGSSSLSWPGVTPVNILSLKCSHNPLCFLFSILLCDPPNFRFWCSRDSETESWHNI